VSTFRSALFKHFSTLVTADTFVGLLFVASKIAAFTPDIIRARKAGDIDVADLVQAAQT
jgi:hypothetical protein